MPSSPVHIKIAYLMQDRLGIENKADFLLGSIAPDSVNYGGFQASEEVRYAAHIRDRSYDIWKQNLSDFYRDNKEKYSDCIDYLKGYLFHSLCDIAWDEVVQPKLFDFLGTLGYGYDDMTAQKWKELYRFNGVVVKEDFYRKAGELILEGKPRAIATCSEEIVTLYRDYVVKDYKDKISYEAPLFLNNSHIEDTIEQMIKMGYVDFK